MWIEWRSDPDYHTSRDTAAHVKPELVRRTGQMLCDFLVAMDARTIAELDAR